ncbi:hypothetical protein [uncultured Dysosmobacter sp.]|uniref:hypothetical protein n=1 Tax=uncultured Dysosmobacter sp. TaxID=2591384 RepID=UPI0026201D86|nr:hypothetical protein [uncultured Dysosmobacter sp.]
MNGPEVALLFTVCMIVCLGLGYHVGEKSASWNGNRSKKAKRKSRHIEKSTVLAVICVLLGGGSIVAYWVAVFRGFYPDASVATTSLQIVVGGVLSYCLYQFGLKNSRNKYGVDTEGNPYKQKLTGEDDPGGVG